PPGVSPCAERPKGVQVQPRLTHQLVPPLPCAILGGVSEVTRAGPWPRAGRLAAQWVSRLEAAWFDFRRHIATAPTAEDRQSLRLPSEDWSQYIPARPTSARAALQALPVREPRD